MGLAELQIVLQTVLPMLLIVALVKLGLHLADMFGLFDRNITYTDPPYDLLSGALTAMVHEQKHG